MSTNVNKASANARQLSDDALKGADQAVQSTRGFINDTLDSASEKVRGLRNNVDPAIERFTSQAKDYAQRGMEMTAEARQRAQEQIGRYADLTGRYVAEQPMRSVLIAAAAGAAVATLVVLASRNSSSRSRY